MYLNVFDIMTGEPIDSPKIVWEENDRYSLIAFLLLSVNKKIGTDEFSKLDAFMAFIETKKEKEYDAGDYDNSRYENIRTTRDSIIREGNLYLDNLDSDDDRYDCIIDELDRVIDGKDNCNIGGGYALLGKKTKYKELKGAPYWIFDYLQLVILDDDYNTNKKRLLKHLAGKWNINKSALSIIESSLKLLNTIKQKRAELNASDMPHHEAAAALEEIDKEEKAAWKELHKLDIAKDRNVSAYITRQNAIADCFEALGGSYQRLRVREEDEPIDDDEDYEEESLTDKIGDRIVDGIYKIGDLICAPFEWMTDKIIQRM